MLSLPALLNSVLSAWELPATCFPWLTPAGCTQTSSFDELTGSEGKWVWEVILEWKNFRAVFQLAWVAIVQTRHFSGRRWHLKHFETKHLLKLCVECCWALHGGTCLSCAVARSCHSSFCPTVVARKATPFLTTEIVSKIPFFEECVSSLWT